MSKTHRSFQERQLARAKLREQTGKLIRPVLAHLDTPRALSVWLLYASGEDAQIAELSCSPLDYDLPRLNDKFRRDYFATKLLSKWDRLAVPWDPQSRAVETAMQAEQRCLRTNQKLQRLRTFRRPL